MSQLPDAGAKQPPAERDVVFNVVWAGPSFEYLRWFVASQMLHCDARYRFIANDCPAEDVASMERFADANAERVQDVFVASEDVRLRHGDCLDMVLDRWNDGPLFALVDPDICATGSFVTSMLSLLEGADVATSGSEVWSDTNVLPEGQLGVSGEFFYDRDGYTFGSPHLALYRRDAIDDTRERWGVGFSSASAEVLSDPARARLDELDRPFLIYDTGKLLNIFLQGDGHRLVHEEIDDIAHIGGLTHHLHPTGYTSDESGETVPDWALWPGMADRFEVTRYTTAVLRSLVDGVDPPPAPAHVEGPMTEKLGYVRSLLTDMVEECRHLVEP